jgi:RNA polymerase sigma-70 factor (ECF subfamily)
MAYFATGSQDDALDIVQDAMLKLVKLYRDRSEQEWRILFHKILQSRIRDWYRRGALRRSLHVFLGGTAKNASVEEETGDPIQQLPDTSGASPARQFANEQAMHSLESALRELPLRQQQALLLRIWEGLDVAQTAQAMGCSEGSVKTHYSRAVHTLRNILGEHWEEHGKETWEITGHE